jgi:hypothetical protein
MCGGGGSGYTSADEVIYDWLRPVQKVISPDVHDRIEKDRMEEKNNQPPGTGQAKTVYDPVSEDYYSPDEYTELLRERRNTQLKQETETFQAQKQQEALRLGQRMNLVMGMRNNNPLRPGQSLIQTTAPVAAPAGSDKYKDLPEAIKDKPPVKSPEQNLNALGSALGIMSNKEKWQDLMGADGMRSLITKSNLQNSTDPQDKIMLERWQAWQRKKRGSGTILPGMSIFDVGRKPVMGLMGEIPAEYLL